MRKRLIHGKWETLGYLSFSVVRALLHLFHLGQLPACVFIVSEVLLVAHKYDGDVGTEVLYFRGPFLRNVL